LFVLDFPQTVPPEGEDEPAETSAPSQWYSTSGYGSTSGTGSGYYSGYNSLYSQPTRASTLDYRHTGSNSGSSGYYSNFSLLQSQYCISVRDSDHLMSMMSQQYPIYQYPTQMINDNNEIYGVNTSLLRKSAFNRSISSPSLKNMFFSGSKNKDINNNHLRH